MEAKKHILPGLIEFIPRLFGDPRGVFYETYSARQMQALGLPADIAWVQDNQSKSQPGVVRGLHFQRPPHAQAKLVRVAHGRCGSRPPAPCRSAGAGPGRSASRGRR